MPELCEETGRTAYPSRDAVVASTMLVSMRGQWQPYRCGACQRWHLRLARVRFAPKASRKL